MSQGPAVAAAVLTAGRSSRMGRPKALLPIGEATFLERVVSGADRAGSDEAQAARMHMLVAAAAIVASRNAPTVFSVTWKPPC